MIQEKLQKARFELLSKKLKKSGKNGYSGFTYYELADFMPQVTEIFYNLKIFSNFSIDENKAFLTVTDWEDKTKEVFTSPIEDLELKGCTKIQALGGVHTYMKRYLYLNALEIVEADMLDAKAGNLEEKTNTKPKQKTELSLKDAEFYEVVNGIDAETDLREYYEQTKELVVDRKAYHQLVTDRLKAIKEKK